MKTKTVGILGGMGPEATLDCFGKIIKNTPAEKDQDHLRILIDSNPGVPSRAAAILENGESPVPVLAAGCRVLERAGADFLIIPCVSVHFFFAEIQEKTDLPILSIFDAVAETINRSFPEIKTVGLLATTYAIGGGFFQKRLERDGIRTLVPKKVIQLRVMDAIYDIKNGHASRPRSEITTDLIEAADSLVSKDSNGAEGIIAGCTEIPLALGSENVTVPYFDSLTILARAAISYAGLEPIPMQ
jgi:aspartate racemase